MDTCVCDGHGCRFAHFTLRRKSGGSTEVPPVGSRARLGAGSRCLPQAPAHEPAQCTAITAPGQLGTPPPGDPSLCRGCQGLRGDACARRAWALRAAEVSSFYSNCDCSELLSGPGETSHGHREPHKAARRLLGVGTSKRALGVRGICLHLCLGASSLRYCWKLPEELGAGPEGPASSTCCPFTR